MCLAQGSVIARIRDAKTETADTKEYVGAVSAILCGSLIALILLLLFAALQIAGIVIGALHLNDCPVQKFIPIFLVAGGSVGMVNAILSGCKRLQESRDDDSSSSTGLTCCTSIIQCFLIGWFIAGCVWVYGNYLPNFDDRTDPKYCDKTLYYFAFSTLTASFAVGGFFIICGCCLAICVACMEA
ncbi:transmembrane protein 272-like [Ornithodoros turicata]